MKRRIASLFMAIAMLLSMGISAVADENEERLIEEVGEEEAIGAERFTDIDRGYWAYNEVDGVVRAGLFNGTTRTRFEPYRNMTRAAFVLVLSRLEGLELENQPVDSVQFSDVKTTSRFAAAINWAVENNIVTGYSDGTFRPDRSINRQQIAALVYRWIINRYLPDHPDREVKLADDPVPQFSDYSDVSTTSDFREALNYCRLHGLINGYSNGTFRPYTRINRGQMAAILYRIVLVITGGTTEDYLVIVDPSSQVHGETDWSASRDGKAVDKGFIEPGDTITILKNPDDRYVVTNVRVVDALGKKVTVKNRTTFILPAADRLPATIYVTYSRQSSGGGGGGGGGTGGGDVVNAYSLTLKAVGDGTGTATLTAASGTVNYGRLTVSPTGSDTLNSVPENQEVRFFVDPTSTAQYTTKYTVAASYKIAVNGVETDQPFTPTSTTPGLYTFKMPAGNVTVTVTFTRHDVVPPPVVTEPTVAVNVVGTGSVSVTKNGAVFATGTKAAEKVAAGDVFAVTWTETGDQEISDIKVDGVSVIQSISQDEHQAGTGARTVLTIPAGDKAAHVITIVFSDVRYSISVKAKLGSHEIELKSTTLKGSDLAVLAAKDLVVNDTLNEAVDGNSDKLSQEITPIKEKLIKEGFTISNVAIDRNDSNVENNIKNVLRSKTVNLSADYDAQIKAAIADSMNKDSRFKGALALYGVTLTADNINFVTRPSNVLVIGLTEAGVTAVYNGIDWSKFHADAKGTVRDLGNGYLNISAAASFTGLALTGGSVNNVQVQPKLKKASEPLAFTLVGVDANLSDAIGTQSLSTFDTMTVKIDSSVLPADNDLPSVALPLSDLFLKSYASLVDDLFAQVTTDDTVKSVLTDFPQTKNQMDSIYNGNANSVSEAYFTVVKDNSGHVSAIGVNGTAVLEEDSTDKSINVLLDKDRLVTLYNNTIDKVNGIRLGFLDEAESDSAARTAVRAGIRVVASKKAALAKLNNYTDALSFLVVKREPTVKDIYYGEKSAKNNQGQLVGLKGTNINYSISKSLPGSAATVMQSMGYGSNVKVTVSFTREVKPAQ